MTTNAAGQFRRMSEATLLANVRQLADRYGLARFHDQDSRGSRRPELGFFDLVLAGVAGDPCLACGQRPSGLILAELKSSSWDGKLPADQQWWQSMALRAGHLPEIWDPMDLWSGQVEKRMASVSPKGGYRRLPPPAGSKLIAGEF